MSRLDELAASLEAVAAELEHAAAHSRRAADHARNQRLPRIGAHAFSAHGHLRRSQVMLDAIAEEWADSSTPEG